MLVMITRPRDDAIRLADALAARGVCSLVEPMLEMVPLAVDLDLEGVQGILVTSANGARALSGSTGRRDVPILAVGDQSAAAARELGFADIAAAGGDAGALAEMVGRKIDPAAGALLHVAGRVVAGDLSGILERTGYQVRRAVVYDARPATALSASAAGAIADKTLDGMLFFSPRTVHTFARLIDKAGLAHYLTGVDAYCLSPAVAGAASCMPWSYIRTAARTDQAAIVDLVCATAKGSEEAT